MLFCCFNRILRNSGLLFGLSLLLCFLPSVGLAQDVDTESVSSLTVEDLTPQEFDTLAGLSRIVLGANAASVSSGNITNDVASILNFLQSLRSWPGNNNSSSQVLYVMPMAGLSNNLDLFSGLRRYLSEEDNGIDRPKGILYEIQRAFYGRSGVPSSDLALLPFLWGSFGFTNALYTSNSTFVDNSIADVLAEIALFYHRADAADPSSGSDFGYLLSDLRDSNGWGNFFANQSSLSSSFDSLPPEPYSGTALYVEEGAISDVWEQHGEDAGTSDSALRVVDANNMMLLASMLQSLSDIQTAISSINGGSSSSYSITNVVSYDVPGSDYVSESGFNASTVASSLRESAGMLLSNAIPASIGAINTNQIFSLTNLALSAMPNLGSVQTFVSDSFAPFDQSVIGTGPEIRIFRSFTHSGITIPGMSLDLSDVRLNTLRERCNLLARFSYALLFLVLTILRVRSFLDYVIAGFSSIYGGEIEASSGDSAKGFNA